MARAQVSRKTWLSLQVLSGILIIAATVHSYLAAIRLRRENQELRVASDREHIIQPFILPPEYLDEISSAHCATSGVAGKTVLLAFSDRSQFSQANVPYWLNLFKSLEALPGGTVQLVTLDGRDTTATLLRDLSARRICYHVSAVTRPRLFAVMTGIVTLPLTLIVDADQSVRRAAIGRLTPSSLEAVRMGLREGGPPTKKPFVLLGPPDFSVIDAAYHTTKPESLIRGRAR
jgi:hypothetical protein